MQAKITSEELLNPVTANSTGAAIFQQIVVAFLRSTHFRMYAASTTQSRKIRVRNLAISQKRADQYAMNVLILM